MANMGDNDGDFSTRTNKTSNIRVISLIVVFMIALMIINNIYINCT